MAHNFECHDLGGCFGSMDEVEIGWNKWATSLTHLLVFGKEGHMTIGFNAITAHGKIGNVSIGHPGCRNNKSTFLWRFTMVAILPASTVMARLSAKARVFNYSLRPMHFVLWLVLNVLQYEERFNFAKTLLLAFTTCNFPFFL